MSEHKIPQPLDNIGCQDLLQEDYSHCGWLRKQSFINRVGKFRWPQIYMVLSGGCIYYFKNEYSTRPAGKFTLYGYNTVSRAQEKVSPKVAPFAFKEWMKHIKSQLVKANGQKSDNYYYTYKRAGKQAAAEEDDKSMTYQEIETDIYGDTNAFKVTSDYALKFKLKGKDDVSDDEDISVPAPPPPRRIPNKDAYKERPPAPLPGEDANKPALPTTDIPSVPPRQTGRDVSAKPAKENEHRNGQRPRRQSEDAVAKVHKELTEALSNSHSRGKRGSKDKEQSPFTARKMAETVVDEDDDEEDSEDYWENIYYDGEDKDKAQEIIRNIGDDGVYLVRTGADGGQVLVVYAENMPKKYKITNENGEYYLKKDGPHADSVEMLMYEYYTTELPTAKACLETPFKLHPKYKG
uniref:SH2 domain-containing protein n=1 Tax=Magallana gigas TaxID=29159 RepID=A0A8W8IIG4_MAGGI